MGGVELLQMANLSGPKPHPSTMWPGHLRSAYYPKCDMERDEMGYQKPRVWYHQTKLMHLMNAPRLPSSLTAHSHTIAAKTTPRSRPPLMRSLPSVSSFYQHNDLCADQFRTALDLPASALVAESSCPAAFMPSLGQIDTPPQPSPPPPLMAEASCPAVIMPRGSPIPAPSLRPIKALESRPSHSSSLKKKRLDMASCHPNPLTSLQSEVIPPKKAQVLPSIKDTPALPPADSMALSTSIVPSASSLPSDLVPRALLNTWNYGLSPGSCIEQMKFKLSTEVKRNRAVQSARGR